MAVDRVEKEMFCRPYPGRIRDKKNKDYANCKKMFLKNDLSRR